MSTTEFEQLVQAVKREPGSEAFSLLAEHHLQRHEVDQALETCRAGFEVNPAYERGAVVFLEVLRQLEDVTQGSEVYGRAIAEHPRSSELRLAWAKLLKHAGRDYEARLRAKEAVDLAPENEEAQVLLTDLSAAAPTQPGAGGPITRPPTATGSIREKVAALKPRAGSAMHGRFDFTPTPAYVEPPPELRERGLAAMAEFFDVSAPTLRQKERFAGPIDPTCTTSQNLFPKTPVPVLASQAQTPTADTDTDTDTDTEAEAPELSTSSSPHHEAQAEAPEHEGHAQRRRWRRWWLFPLATLLITVPVAGAFIYKEAKQRALHAALKTAIDNVRGDRLQA
ncbi:MAG: hypothetical protein JRH20_07300, partial [Deltaproteobacteria bacterium]|nr:hypothetical protein [Deltaproteobacteria bacterium]